MPSLDDCAYYFKISGVVPLIEGLYTLTEGPYSLDSNSRFHVHLFRFDLIYYILMLYRPRRCPQVRRPYTPLAMFLFAHLFRLFLMLVCRLGLCPFSGLVCDLLPK